MTAKTFQKVDDGAAPAPLRNRIRKGIEKKKEVERRLRKNLHRSASGLKKKIRENSQDGIPDYLMDTLVKMERAIKTLRKGPAFQNPDVLVAVYSTLQKDMKRFSDEREGGSAPGTKGKKSLRDLLRKRKR